MSTKAPETAPALPSGCVDFNKLHDALLKGDAEAVAKATIVPDGEKAPKEPPAPKPAAPGAGE